MFDDVTPWISTRDIQAGERWGTEIGRHLEDLDFGTTCLTSENLEAPWIMFEAGALSKFLDESRFCPYLFDVDVSEITGSLAQLHATRAEKASALDLIRDPSTLHASTRREKASSS